MPAKLVVDSLIDQSRQEYSLDKPRLTLGRRPGNDLHFNRPEISGNHAAFLNEDEEYFIMDLGSTNGTLLNGAQLAANAKYPLKEKDVVTINPFKITLEVQKDMGATMLEMSGDPSTKRGGTMLDLGNKVSTGTDPGPIEPLPAANAPAPEAAPSPPPPESVPAAPAPESPAEMVQGKGDAAPVEESKSGMMGVLLWLILGGVFLLAALGLIIFLLSRV